MAFLDNSGDIILDAVLTDLGRKKLANGNFKVTKYAFGDDEIDYGLYDKTNTTGSAYYGLTIQALPIQQALTNGAASLKNKLYTLTGAPDELLYLPNLKLDQVTGLNLALASGRNAYAVIADETTYNNLTIDLEKNIPAGVIYGLDAEQAMGTVAIRTPLGLDNGNPGKRDTDLDAALDSSEGYAVVVDGRFLQVATTDENGAATLATSQASTNVFSGNDNLVVYNFERGADPGAFDRRISNTNLFNGPSTNSVLRFSLVLSNKVDVDFLFTNYKTSSVSNYVETGFNVDVISTNVEVIALSTGESLTIPVEVIRKQ